MNSAGKRSQLETLRSAKGFALNALGRYDDALKAFESARKISGNGKVSCFGKGLVFAQLGEWEKTLKAFDTILLSDPDNTQAAVMKAFALVRLGEFEKATFILDGIAANDDSDLPACLLGFAFSRLENFEKALRAYRKAIELNPKNSCARNGLAELYFRLGNSMGALKELEVSIAESPEDAFSRCLKGRIELEEQACEAAIESFRRALALDTENHKLLLWDAYARYMYAEASFDEGSARFRYMLLAAAGKLEKSTVCQRPGDSELKAYSLYFLGLFYCRVHYFRKAAEKLEECLKLKNSGEVKRPASMLLKNIHTGPLKPAWWEWWLDREAYSLPKKAGLGIIFFLMFGLLLSHPVASTLPLTSWPASFLNQAFFVTGTDHISWEIYGKEYTVLILLLLSALLLPGLAFGKRGKRELELEILTPPPLDFDIPLSIIEEFTERLKKSLFSPEPMEESIQKLGDFWNRSKRL